MSLRSKSIQDHPVRSGRPANRGGHHVNPPKEPRSTIILDPFADFEATRDAFNRSDTQHRGRARNGARMYLDHADIALPSPSGATAFLMTLQTSARPGWHVRVAENAFARSPAFCDTVPPGLRPCPI